MSSFLVKITLFLLPLTFWPVPLKFELAKIAFFSIGSFFLVVLFLLKYHQKKQSLPSYNSTWLLWVSILLLSTIWGGKTIPGLLGYGYRHQGVFFFLALGIWMMAFEILSKKEKGGIGRWIGLAVTVESLIVLGQWAFLKLGFPLLAYNSRPIGTFGEPNAAAGFLVTGLPILTNVFPFQFIFLIIAAIILTGSKASLGALLAQGVIYGYLKMKNFPGKKILTILGLSAILLVGIFGVWQEREASPFENRWLIWNLGIKAALKKPVLGYGAEGVIEVYESKFQQLEMPLEDLIIDRSHNLFLDITLFSGLLGLVIFLKWFYESLKKIKEVWKFIGLVGFLIFSFFQPLGVVHWLYLVFLLSPD